MPTDMQQRRAEQVGRVWQTNKSPRQLLVLHRTIEEVDALEDELCRMARPLRDPNAPGVEIQAAPNSGAVAALKAVLDSKWKRINKSLPDLKAVEHTGSVDSTITSRVMGDLELLHHWQAVRRKALQAAALKALESDEPDERVVDYLS